MSTCIFTHLPLLINRGYECKGVSTTTAIACMAADSLYTVKNASQFAQDRSWHIEDTLIDGCLQDVKGR